MRAVCAGGGGYAFGSGGLSMGMTAPAPVDHEPPAWPVRIVGAVSGSRPKLAAPRNFGRVCRRLSSRRHVRSEIGMKGQGRGIAPSVADKFVFFV